MSRISVDVSSARIPVLQVGYQGENEVTDVLFDISSWITEFGEGVAQLRVKRPGNSEEESYVLSLTITDGIAVWTVSETDTFNKGNGKVQLSYLVGNIVKKAVIYPYKVGKSIVGADNPVDPFDSWIERSKAWAIGETLDGNAVPETDETYQNNAKYYAEQADILGSAQVVLATEQVTLATEKATLATVKANAAAASETNAAASEAAVNGVSTQLTTRMSAIETEQSVQGARMDTFTSLPEGSTSGNAELADIRVGANGTTYDTAGNAVRGQIGELKSDLIKSRTIKEDETSYRRSDEIVGNEMRVKLYSTNISVDDEAMFGLTYKELFYDRNKVKEQNYDNGSYAPFIPNNGTPTVTDEKYHSKGYSLKAFGNTPQNIFYSVPIEANHYYFIGAFVNVTRYVQGKAGVNIDGKLSPYFEAITNGFESTSRIILFGTSGDISTFIGSWGSADLDCYIDDVCFIDITDIYDNFGGDVSLANETLKKAYSEYIEAKDSFVKTISFAIKNPYENYTSEQAISAFLNKMNEKATSIGMNNTHFYSPHGMVTNSYSTPLDLLKMGICACGYREAVNIWSTPTITTKIGGSNSRIVTVPSAFINGFSSDVTPYYDVLGGKSGSLIWSDNDEGYHRANVAIVDINNKPCVISVMVLGTTAYQNIYKSIKEICDMVKTSMNGNEPTEGENIQWLTTHDGGYCACVLPENCSNYVNNYSNSKLIGRLHSQHNNETVSRMPASTSKIMTMLVALDYATDLNEIITIESTDITDGSGSTYYDGDTLTLIDALKILMMESSNTLANAIARHIGYKIIYATID